MMQETQLASHISHMNLTGTPGTRETSETNIRRASHTFMLFLSLSLRTTDIKIIKSVQPGQPGVQELGDREREMEGEGVMYSQGRLLD